MVVFPVGGLEAKNAQHSGESSERKKNEPSEQRSDKSEQRELNGSFSFCQGVQKVVFLMQNAMG